MRPIHLAQNGETYCGRLVSSKQQLTENMVDVTCRKCQKMREEEDRRAKFRRYLHGDGGGSSE